MSERSERIGVEECWGELVTTALLGTDRRSPPEPPTGPIADAVGDLALVAGDDAPDVRYLNQVAVVALGRRLAVCPGEIAPRLAPPPDDPRPLCSPAAAARWRLLVDDWPLLEDEWLAVLAGRGEQLPGDLLIDLLDRHRTDTRRRRLVERIGGPVVAWSGDHLDAAPGPPPSPGPEQAALPELPLHPELAAHLTAGEPETLAAAALAVVRSERFTATDRRLVEHVVARCDRAALPRLAEAFAGAGSDTGSGVAVANLADLARHRLAMLADFETANR